MPDEIDNPNRLTSCEIEVTVRALVGAINGGGPIAELRTFNSNVYVRKGP